MKIGIIGAGWIADKMGETLTGLDPSMKYAIAARDLGRAQEFARHWGFEKAYGSYKEMVEEIRKRLNFTTLQFQRLDDLEEAIGIGPCKLCTYCWSGRE